MIFIVFSVNRLPKGKKAFMEKSKEMAIHYLMSAIDLYINLQVGSKR